MIRDTNIGPQRGSIYWFNYNLTIGTEVYKIRPALVLSISYERVITLPITSNVKELKEWQMIIKDFIKGKDGKLLLDQIRSFDKQRILRKIGEISISDLEKVNELLRKMLYL